MFRIPFFIVAITIGLLADASAQNDDAAETSERKTVVCSTQQIADFTRNIVGDDMNVVCVLAAGQDPHVYTTTLADANAVRQADLCLQNGWDLEGHGWMEKLAKNAGKPVVSCVTGVTPLTTVEGDDGQSVKDPHAWMTPLNAAQYVRNITQAVSDADPEHAAAYRARAELYLTQLRALDRWIRRQVNTIPANSRVLVSHHDAFSYFCNAYGFEARSPGSKNTKDLVGMTSERRAEVVQTIRDFGVKAIFVEASLDDDKMRVIADEAGVAIGGTLYSDSMGPEDTAAESYIGMMRENVLTLVDGLR